MITSTAEMVLHSYNLSAGIYLTQLIFLLFTKSSGIVLDIGDSIIQATAIHSGKIVNYIASMFGGKFVSSNTSSFPCC